MSKRKMIATPKSIAADPSQWSEQSKQSVAFHFNFIREYTDKPFNCRRCGAACVFSAEDQKYTYEVKKASIDQRRKFCAECWSESHRLKAGLADFEKRWADDKRDLQTNIEFLSGWLELLNRWKEFEPYKHDIARINMIRGLLGLKE